MDVLLELSRAVTVAWKGMPAIAPLGPTRFRMLAKPTQFESELARFPPLLEKKKTPPAGLLRDGDGLQGLTYIFGSVFLGLVAVRLGMFLART